jgi:hypothetical protein
MENKGIHIDEVVWSKLLKMNSFLADFKWGDGIYIGDNDDSQLLYSQNEKKYSLIESISISSKCLKGNFQDKDFRNHLMFSGWDTPENVKLLSSKDYISSGYFQIKEKDIQLIYDVAEIGYDSIAAHGHSDVLSVLLRYKGQSFFVDPGTYQYHWKYKQWREYFKGSVAHNTISIDGMNQALSQGPMLWTIKPSVKIINTSIRSCEAEHDGFVRQGVNVKHNRRVELFSANQMTITDTLIGDSDRSMLMTFHLHPSVKVEQNRNELRLIHTEGAVIRIKSELLSKLQVIKGQESPKLGWFSRSYDFIEESNTLVFPVKVEKSSTFITDIFFE